MQLDHQAWQFNPAILQYLCQRFNLHYPTIDLYASHRNKITPLYATKHSTPLPHLVDGLKSYQELNTDPDFTQLRNLCRQLQIPFPKEISAWANVPFTRFNIRAHIQEYVLSTIPSFLCVPDWNNTFTSAPDMYPAAHEANTYVFILPRHKESFTRN